MKDSKSRWIQQTVDNQKRYEGAKPNGMLQRVDKDEKRQKSKCKNITKPKRTECLKNKEFVYWWKKVYKGKWRKRKETNDSDEEQKL